MTLSKIEREVTLHFGGLVEVVIVRPRGKYWIKHTYLPTPASIERIKRLMGYPDWMIYHTGPVVHWKEYSAYI